MHSRHTFLSLLACGLVAGLVWPTECGAALRVERFPPVVVASADEVLDPAVDPAIYNDLPTATAPSRPAKRGRESWTFQVLPEGLLYKSYMAGVKEPRFAAQWVSERTADWIWDIALGGRVGIIRHGTCDPLNPEGGQIDIEGAAFPRLDMGRHMDLVACDYRFGIPFTHALGRHHYKLAYYHISSHLGDEWMLLHPGTRRINYGRESMVVGYSFYPWPELRLYGEAAYAFGTGDYTGPWEFQFGVEYSPAQPTGLCPVPFVAVNGHLREEVDFGGNVVVQSGWLWRGATGHLLRMGMQCFVGMSDQYEFFDQYESKVGFGIWYDY